MTYKKSKQIKTKLHVVFVDTNRRVIRDVYSNCYFMKDDDMPKIRILDKYITDILAIKPSSDIPFYDVNNNRFNFTTPNVSSLNSHSEDDIDVILIEILENVPVDFDDGFNHIHLTPGLWSTDKNGIYRMCDNSILNIIMDTKILPMVADNVISFDDGSAMTLFFTLLDKCSVTYFDNYEDKDDCNNSTCQSTSDNNNICIQIMYK